MVRFRWVANLSAVESTDKCVHANWRQPGADRGHSESMLDDLRRILTLFAGFTIAIHVAVLLHEFGHAFGYWCSGGTVSAIVMEAPLPAGHVTGTSESRLMPVWGGVAFGVMAGFVLQFISWSLSRCPRLHFAVKMSAAFCFAHNGMYLLVGSLLPFADALNMITLGAPRWLLFPIGVALIVMFVLALTDAVGCVHIGASRSVWRWIMIIELGLWSFLGLMVTSMAFMPVPADVRKPTIAFVFCYAVCFAVTAIRARGKCGKKGANISPMPQEWSTFFALTAGAVILIGIEWITFRRA